MSDGARRVGFLGLLAALAVFSAGRLDFRTDMASFMPDGDRDGLAAVARHLATGDAARTMVLAVGTADGRRDDARTGGVARALADELARMPGIAWARRGPAETDFEQLWKAYFPRRFGLVSLEPEREIPLRTTDEALAAAALRARDALAGPAAAMAKRTIGADPLGFSGEILARLVDDNPALEVREGTFFSRDGWAVVLLATKASAFDASAQAPLLERIDAIFAREAAAAGGGLALRKGGAARFAVATEKSMIADMKWIAALSLVGNALLVAGWFRGFGRFMLAMLPPLAGVVVATASGLVAFGHLDGLTLAFGMSLIGVTVDYPVHLLNHHTSLVPPPPATRRLLAPSLAMGALTTVASFAGLGITSFPAFRQIAFFAAVGVAAAVVTTLVAVPWFLADEAPRHDAPPRLGRALAAAVAALVARRRAVLAVVAIAAVAATATLPRLRWQDDLSKLGNMDPALEREEAEVRARVAPWEAGRVVLVTADTEEEVLQRTEEVTRRLEALRRGGAIGGYRSASALVRSRDLQRRNVEALAAVPGLASRVEAAFSAAGFRAGAVAGFARDLSAPPPAPLVPSDLAGTALGSLLAPLLVDLGDRRASIVQVADPRDGDAVAREVAAVPGAHYFVQRDFVNALYAGFRDTTLQQLFVGGLLVLGVLGARYRRLRPTLAAFAPSVLVPLGVLAGLAAAGEPVHLLHVVSLVMVTGMGVDYGIFLVDSAGNREHAEATLVSLLLCCLTTVFGFAVIGVSSHPALRAMGVTIGAGVTLSLLLAPVSLLLLGPGADAHGGRP